MFGGDLHSEAIFWTDSARASSVENQSHGGDSLATLLVQAIADQIANNLMDTSYTYTYTYADVASQRLLTPGGNGRILYWSSLPLVWQGAAARALKPRVMVRSKRKCCYMGFTFLIDSRFLHIMDNALCANGWQIIPFSCIFTGMRLV